MIIRVLFSLFVLLPMITCGLVCRHIASSRVVQGFALLILIAVCAGCGVTTYALEHDARQCHAEAVTVAAMTECSRLYPQHNGTVSDRLSQPLGELERHIQHRTHDHD